MMQKRMAVTFGAGLMFTAAIVPAEAFHDSLKHKHHTSARHVSWYGHRHHGHVSPARARHWRAYGLHIRGGFPPNCRHLQRRAYLTGNAYWQYASASCRFDSYKYY